MPCSRGSTSRPTRSQAKRSTSRSSRRAHAAGDGPGRLLFAAREKRVKPGRDEKILPAWNGLMLRAFAEAARVLGRADYRATAEKNAAFLLATLRRDGRLLRTHKDGRARLNGYVEDYAALADGLLALYEVTFEPRWFAEARTLAEEMLRNVWDDAAGGFFNTSDDHEPLISRPKDLFDNAIPAGNSLAIDVLLRLAALTGEGRYAERAERTLRALSGVIPRAPGG